MAGRVILPSVNEDDVPSLVTGELVTLAGTGTFLIKSADGNNRTFSCDSLMEDKINEAVGGGSGGSGLFVSSITYQKRNVVGTQDAALAISLKGDTADKYDVYIGHLVDPLTFLNPDEYLPSEQTAYQKDAIQSLVDILGQPTIDAMTAGYGVSTLDEVLALADYTHYSMHVPASLLISGFNIYIFDHGSVMVGSSYNVQKALWIKTIVRGCVTDFLAEAPDGSYPDGYEFDYYTRGQVDSAISAATSSIDLSSKANIYEAANPTIMDVPLNTPLYGKTIQLIGQDQTVPAPPHAFITFSDGSYIGSVESFSGSYGVFNADGSLIRRFNQAWNYWDYTSYVIPDGLSIVSISDDAGDYQVPSMSVIFDTGTSYDAKQPIDVVDVYNEVLDLQKESQQTSENLQAHVLHDADLYQAILAAARQEAMDVYNGTNPPLSSDGTTIIGTGGVLSLGGGGEYPITSNGGITITFSAVLALGNAQVLVNGSTVFDSGALSLISIPPPKTVRVNTGDVITTSGSLGLLSSLSVVFYPNAPLGE